MKPIILFPISMKAYDVKENKFMDAHELWKCDFYWNVPNNCFSAYGCDPLEPNNQDKDGMGDNEDLIAILSSGLYDKNKKEIFDRDILMEYPGFGCEWKPRIGVVRRRYAMFWLDRKGYSTPLDDHDCSLEIIGNEFQNQDILEKEGIK